MDSTVTKVKNPGRQAAGKKLVEWNKRNKEALLKNQKEPESSANEVPNPVENKEPASQNQVPSTPLILGILVILGVGGTAYYYYYQKKDAPPSPQKKAKIYME